jgi:DnaJ-class molecular chaperone
VEFQGYYALLGCAQYGRAGDLYLVISVRPDARFERSGDDLRTRVQAPLLRRYWVARRVFPRLTGDAWR